MRSRRRRRRRRERRDIHPCHWRTITSVTVRTEAEFLWVGIPNCMLLYGSAPRGISNWEFEPIGFVIFQRHSTPPYAPQSLVRGTPSVFNAQNQDEQMHLNQKYHKMLPKRTSILEKSGTKTGTLKNKSTVLFTTKHIWGQ